jgi:uncharacterized protein YacL (UPF0231 family)
MNRSYSKIRHIQESNIKLEKRILNEQSTSNNDYLEIANYLHASMDGLNTSEDAENVKSIIINRVKNKNDWEQVKKAFGVKDGENLEQWINNEMRLNLQDILNIINQNDTNFKKENSMYEVGTKIKLISNRQFVIGRGYNYGTNENILDMENVVVTKKDTDGIVVKVPYMYYQPEQEQFNTSKEKIQPKSLSNVCVKIPFKDIIQWREDTLQISWFTSSVDNHIVNC